MFPNAAILAAGVNSGPTRDEFIAHITAKAVDGTYAGTTNVTFEGTSRAAYKIKSTPTNDFTVMYGSSWDVNYYADFITKLNRVMLHALPSASAFSDLVAGATPVYLELRGIPDYYPAFSSLNRNGYPSLSLAPGNQVACWVYELIYWDGEKAVRMDPFNKIGPTPYTW